MKRIGFNEFFRDLNIQDHFPVIKFVTKIGEWFKDLDSYYHVDFSGIEQLTDEVIFILEKEIKDDVKFKLVEFSFVGCSFLSDNGIEILSKAFPDMRKLDLRGCSKLTERSLFYLRKYVKELKELNFDGTNVGILPDLHGCQATYSKCPIFSESLPAESESPTPVHSKLVIMCQEEIEINMTEYIKTGKLNKISQPITYSPEAFTFADKKINVFELHCSEAYMSPFITEGAAFMIFVDVDVQSALDLGSLQPPLRIMKMVDFIRAIVLQASIIVVGCFRNEDGKMNIKQLGSSLNAMFNEQVTNMAEHLEKEHYSKPVDKDFPHQWRYVQSMQVAKKANFTILFMGMPIDESDQTWTHYSSLREIDPKDLVSDILQKWFASEWTDARDGLERLNKSDISEMKSFTKPPAVILKVGFCLAALLSDEGRKLKGTWSEVKILFNDHNIINKMLDFETIVAKHDPVKILKTLDDIIGGNDVDLESAKKVSHAGGAFWLWVKSLYAYFKHVAPLAREQNARQTKLARRKNADSTPDLMRILIEEMFGSIGENIYQWDSFSLGPGFRSLQSRLSKLDGCGMVLKSLEDIPDIEFKKKPLELAVCRLNRMGLCCFYEYLRSKPVFTSPAKLVKAINVTLTEVFKDSKFNGLQVWSLHTSVPVLTYGELKESLMPIFTSESEYNVFYFFLRNMGLLGETVRTRELKGGSWGSQKKVYFSWHNVSDKPCIHLPDGTVEMSLRKFLEFFFPNYTSTSYNKNDINFKFSFKFRVGMAANLFSQIVCQSFPLGWTVQHVWQTGLLLRKGVVQMMLRHNIHSTMASSSLDVEARVGNCPNGEYVVYEYMWSVLSPFLTMIESIILAYPHTHHKLRYYCRGECFKDLGKENTFSPTEMSVSLTRNVRCSKCRTYQMSQSEWQMLVGRQWILPSHMYQYPNARSCDACWKWRDQFDPIWKMQASIYPSFVHFCFTSDPPESLHWRGNILTSSKAHPVSILSTNPLWPGEFTYLRLEFLDTKGLKLQFETKRGKPVLEVEFNPFRLNVLESIAVLLSIDDVSVSSFDVVNIIAQKLKTLKLSADQAEEEEEEEEEKGNREGEDDSKHSQNKSTTTFTVCFTFNGREVGRVNLLETCLVRIMAEQEKVEEDEEQDKGEVEKKKVIVSCRTFPLVTARFFRPGTVLLRKTGVGGIWSPAIVHKVEEGLVFLQDEDGNKFPPVSPSSSSILPPGRYPDEVNVVISKKRFEGVDQWYNFLSLNPIYTPCSFALFPQLIDDERYQPLTIRGVKTRKCLLQPNAVDSIMRVSYTALRSLQPSATPTILLPQGLGQHQIYFVSRMAIQHQEKQELHVLCKGNIVASKRQDMHLMNTKGHPLSVEEWTIFHKEFGTKFLWTLTQCIRTRMFLSHIDEIFPNLDPNINRQDLAHSLVSMMRSYRDSVILRMAASVKSYLANFLTVSMHQGGGWKEPGNRRKSTQVIQKQHHKNSGSFKMLRKTVAATSTATPSFMPKSEVICDGHRLSKQLQKVTADTLGPYSDSVQIIRLNKFPNAVIPSPALLSCVNLTTLELVSCGLTEMEWISDIPNLSYIDFTANQIEEIPKSINKLNDILAELVLAKNPIKEFPDHLTQVIRLYRLNLDGTKLTHLPEDIGNLKELGTLSVCRTEISRLPQSFNKMKRLRILKISGIAQPIDTHKGTKSDQSLSLKEWLKFCTDYEANGYALAKLSADEWEEFFCDFDTEDQARISGDQMNNLLMTFFNSFGRLCGNDDSDEFPLEVLDCLAVDTLVMSRQAIKAVPDDISRLSLLRRLIIDNCPYLETVSGSISECNIEVLALSGCPLLKTPPREIISQGMASTIAYLSRLNTGSIKCRKTKLMLVGLGGAGKTSLIRAMMSSTYKVSQADGEGITDGIDISTWKVERTDEEPILYSVWDFAGQTLYYNTHQFFLTGRSVYMLVWNMRMGHEHAGIQFWLNSIVCHAPKSPIFVIGTHADQVASSEMPVDELRRRYPSIVAFMNISSYTGQGVKELVELMINTTLKERYMGEKVPEAWLNFEKEIVIKRSVISILRWSEVMELAKTKAIYDSEVRQVVRFLHELGTIQHFDTELLRDVVIVSPQWLVDVMACLVSVHNETIVEGRFYHKDMPIVWKDYRADIRKWLLQLTETFDLTFPIPGEDLNIVPCLLPFKMPKSIDWDELIVEDKIVYRFEYLPAGLFNRAQVRLCQFSDSLDIWQHGSLLRKNGHEALVYREDDTNVVIRVHGPKPANIIMLIHEVFESLIEESFNGVSYRYNIPCLDCMRAKINNPALFSSRVLHHAIEMNTSFIQCHSQFHCVSIARLQSMIPAENDRDYLAQIEDSLNSLNAASKDLEFDIFLLGAAADIPDGPNDEFIHPERLKKDLEEAGLSVWKNPTPDKESLDVLVKGLENSKIFMPLMSDAFLADESCQAVFSLAIDTMKKPLILAMVGEKKSWRTSALGMKVADQVYQNFRPSQYKVRLKETLEKSRELLSSVQLNRKDGSTDVFISYCWKNSRLAVERGYARPGPREALGFGDPVEVKEYLESNGLNCWLDVERVGVNGLFSDICSGLNSSSVFVAFVSDEYAASVNCQMEIRFAHVTLGLPIVLAIVGTGYMWESTEVGMMSLAYPKVNLQVTNHTGYELILQYVQEALESSRDGEDAPKTKARENKEAAFREMYELAQRKLFRQIQSFVSSEDSYPTLFVIDFLPEDDEPDEEEEEEEEELLNQMLEKISEEAAADGRLGFRLLCEDESGWHSVHKGWPINLAGEDLRELLRLAAPFLSRISLILKHSDSNLEFLVEAANRFNMLSFLEQNAGNGTLMRATYQAIRNHVRLRDKKGKCGYLRRCHMPSGKILWLCPEHQKQSRVIPLDFNLETNNRSASDDSLLENLRHLSAKSDIPLPTSGSKNGSQPGTARSRPRTGLVGLSKHISNTSDTGKKRHSIVRKLSQMRMAVNSFDTPEMSDAKLESKATQGTSPATKSPAPQPKVSDSTQKLPTKHHESSKQPIPKSTQNESPKAFESKPVKPQERKYHEPNPPANPEMPLKTNRSVSASNGARPLPDKQAVHRQNSDVGVTQDDARRVITGVHTVSRTCVVM